MIEKTTTKNTPKNITEIDSSMFKKPKMSDTPPVYILIRTSGRPKFFEKMYQSILEQTYSNIITVVHIDNDFDKYVKGDYIIRGEPVKNAGRGYYNLYNNTLLNSIPVSKHGPGWYHFIDDDDMYSAPDVIERLVKVAKKDFINVGRVQRWDKTIFPAKWKQQNSFQTECFFLHTDHRLKGTWWAKRGGDHFYSRQITRILPTNWIGPDKKSDPEFFTICKAQEGKGRGMRLDAGQEVPTLQKEGKVSISRVGARLAGRPGVEVVYKKNVNILQGYKKGKPGEHKILSEKDAFKLEKKGFVTIVKKNIKIEDLE